MPETFQHEHVAMVPRGYKVRTVTRGDHEIRVAFPPGRRVRGSGRLVEILHPAGENPLCKIVNLVNPSTLELKRGTRERARRIREARSNPSSVYSKAVSLGYPYLRGEGRVAKDGRTWLSRVTKTADGSGPALFVGWDGRKWVVEKESGSNPRKSGFTPEEKKELRRLHFRPSDFDTPEDEQAARETLRKLEDIRTREARKANPDRYEVIEVSAGGVPAVMTKPLSRKDAKKFLAEMREVSRVGQTGAHHFMRRLREKNPTRMQVSFDPAIKKYLAVIYDPKFGNLYASGYTKKQAAAALHERVREYRRSGRLPAGGGYHENPDELDAAEGLYEEFHGRAPREILEMQESSETRGEYTALGELVELTMIAPTGDRVQIKFASDGVRVASSPNGEQLYLLGGNQDISGSLKLFGVDENKDLIDLGEAKQIVYEAAKWQTDFTPQEWKHDFGEESGVRPRAFFDQLKKRIFFAGGNYQVKRPGIVD